jgi:hypothetical protein
MWRAGPLGKGGNVATEHGSVHLVKGDSEESSGVVGRVWLELGVHLNYEGGSDSGEQTGLRPKSARAHPSDVYDIRISMLC